MSKKRFEKQPHGAPNDVWGGHVSHAFLWVPRLHFGVIWASLRSAKLHFEVIWATIWPHDPTKAQIWGKLAPLKPQIWGHVVPRFAPIVAVRFMFYTSLQPPRQKPSKTRSQNASKKHITGGGRYRETLYDNNNNNNNPPTPFGGHQAAGLNAVFR